MTLVDHTRPTGGQSAGSPPPAGPAEAVMLQVLDTEGRELARGLSRYDAEEAARLIGAKGADIEARHGYSRGDALIHRDDMVLR